MKTKKFIYILVFVGVVIVLLLVMQKMHKTQSEQRAEQIILGYIEAKGLNIQRGTEEYTQLMKGILLGEHPDLTGENSRFIRDEIERDYIIDYAARHLDLRNRKNYKEPDVEEAVIVTKAPGE